MQRLLVAVLALLLHSPASAGEDDAAVSGDTADDEAAASGDASATSLDTVTVTAQHRVENVQRIPLAVSVVDGEALRSIHATDVRDLATLVPSVTFSAGNELRNNSIRIRGVGTDVFSTGVEPSVSTVIDGVVMQRPGAAFADLLDIERIEVLRGPQGTLFGKNASAGVVNVITRAPDFDGDDVSASALVAQDDEVRVDGAVSGPIGNGFAYRVAGFHRSLDGNVVNLDDGRTLGDVETWGARAKLAWRSSDQRRDATLSADYARFDSDCCALPLVVASDNPRAVLTRTEVGHDNDEVNNDVDPFVRQRNYGASLTANVALGQHTLTSITAWRRFENTSDVDLDDTPGRFITSNHNVESSRTTTQELRLASPLGDAFDYLIGAYWFDGSVENELDRRGLNLAAIARVLEDGLLVPRILGDEAVLAGRSRVDSRNAAVFGQANWHPTRKLTLTAGARYIDEAQRLFFERPRDGRFNGADQPPTNPAFGPVEGRYDDDALVGKLAITYDFSQHVMGYVGWSTGYKGEGIAATLGLTRAQFEQLPAPAETTSLLEAGFKTTLLDHTLTLNTTAFHMRIHDYQAQTFNAATGLFLLTSAGGVAIDGLEIELVAQPTDRLSLSGGITYLDAAFDDVRNGPCYTGQTPQQGCVGGVQNLDGKPFMNAPKLRTTISGRYTWTVRANADAYVQGDWRWQDEVVFDISQNPNLRQGPYGIADLSAGLLFGAGRYDLSVFVKNVFDRTYAAGMMAVGTAGGANAYAHQLPRDFHRYAGLSLRMQF
ncbi:MAG TPA: TonB-dependent receptor [Lysobacter sp.]